MKINPPFRADHVGSLLRMPALKKAREQVEQKCMAKENLKAIEDESVREVVRIQEEAGLKVVTDGEQRRTFFHVDFLEQIEGVTVTYGDYEIKFRGTEKDVKFAPPVLSVTGKLSRPEGGIVTSDMEFLAGAKSPESTAKICIPSPSMLHFRGGRSGIDEKAYPDLDEFFADLARIYQEEIDALYQLGCRYVQMDDTNLAYLCDPEHCERVRDLGEDPDKLPSLYANLISECVKKRPEDMAVGIHLCRGNHRSSWAAQGGYEPVAEVMFNETAVDTFFLEYDDARSGGFSPLRFVPKDKSVVLGLISTKQVELEDRAEVKARVKEASEFIDLDQCCLSPQCGFSSTHFGNDISYERQSEKLKLVVDLANEIWT